MYQLLRIATLGLFAWFILASLGNRFWLLPWLVTVIALVNAVIVWMIRAQPATTAKLCRRNWLYQYVRTVCWLTGDEVPTDSSSNESASRLLLHTRREFDDAVARAKKVVRGHDDIVERFLERVYENQRLRTSRRAGSWKGPLALLLLVGNEGVGKRYLTRVIAKLLYKEGGVEVFQCERLTVSQLLGTKDAPGQLLEAVSNESHCMICFERIDAASADVQRILAQVATIGKLRAPGSDRDISFENAVVVLTTSKVTESLKELDDQQPSQAAWQQRAIELIGDQTQVDPQLLGAVTDLFYFAAPSDRVKAEVIALLMKDECSAHQIRLSQVAPSIIATQVYQLDESSGFGPAPQRVKKLLRGPLLAAADHKDQPLSLCVRA